jgi:hypothetical protein
VGAADPLAAPAGGGGKYTGPPTGGAIGPWEPVAGGVVPTDRPKSLRGGPPDAGGPLPGADAPERPPGAGGPELGAPARPSDRPPSELGRSSGFARLGRLPGPEDPGEPPDAALDDPPDPVPCAAVGGSWSDVPFRPAAASAARALAAA